jgi:hypothetical protein
MGDKPRSMFFLHDMFLHKHKNRVKILVKTRIEPSICYGTDLCGYAVQCPLNAKINVMHVDDMIDNHHLKNHHKMIEYTSRFKFNDFFKQPYPTQIPYYQQIIIKSNLNSWPLSFKDQLIYVDCHHHDSILLDFWQLWQGDLLMNNMPIHNQNVKRKTKKDLLLFLNENHYQCSTQDFNDVCHQLALE